MDGTSYDNADGTLYGSVDGISDGTVLQMALLMAHKALLMALLMAV